MSLILRAHHLLCLSFYQGAGYSQDFCKAMDKVQAKCFENPAIRMQFVDGLDAICAHCPNAESGKCALGNEEVQRRDQLCLSWLGIKAGEQMAYTQAMQRLSEAMAKDHFEDCCATCRWYREGFCSWELWQSHVEQTAKEIQ